MNIGEDGLSRQLALLFDSDVLLQPKDYADCLALVKHRHTSLGNARGVALHLDPNTEALESISHRWENLARFGIIVEFEAATRHIDGLVQLVPDSGLHCHTTTCLI